MKLKERTLQEALKTNLSLIQPFPEPKTRNVFWKDYAQINFQEMVNKWMYPEKIPLSLYILIYYREKRFLYTITKLYERVFNKLNLGKLIIKIQAK